MKKLLLLICISWLSVHAFDSQRAGFSVTVNGEINPYKLFSTFIMPGAEIVISSTEAITVKSSEVTVNATAFNTRWKLSAPITPGVYVANVTNKSGNVITVNVLVLTPLSQMSGEYLNKYRIGSYPSQPLRGNQIYNPPKGLFEVTQKNLHLKLTPHFTLSQFLCKQAGDFPKYVMVRERLLLKLEFILERVNEKGYEVETFGFISGYRTPFYNKSIGNVQYSRHVYGGAADIFIDQNKDGRMDDLNKDGTVDEKDVRIFYNIVESEYSKDRYSYFVGGLGFYRKNSRHSGFIHVDVRGSKARW
ncbi:Peptidase M15 [Ekhidna lutea]|uniref:Peptidase M15 n=1 Tax=Ekhidna lutea TaxID=447679 RepID=A0A239F9P2_EKHLU|nr:D-Ala-D-Ala carboxypeptidase family metallohydrolase [Ekhidna lutea]SNS52872.1 Peptidase M15 [Ekhidna lutea]